MIYLDNNATTVMPPEVQRELLSWCNRGNPSAGYASAKESRAMMDGLRRRIAAVASVPHATVIFTSGASESNATALQSVAASAWAREEHPHVVVSAVEHKSLIAHASALVDAGRITLTLVPVGVDGRVHPADVRASFRRETVGVFVMHANNETGAVNDVVAIARDCAQRRVHYHCDMVQTFARRAPKWVDAPATMAMSFHKIHGAPGVGALITTVPIAPLVHGSQNNGLRGGTENLPGLGAAAAALNYTIADRARKTAEIARLANVIKSGIARSVPTRSYVEYESGGPRPFEVVFFESAGQLCGTILLSVVDRRRVICNTKMKLALEDAGIVLSIGSACNTASASASHVLYAMGCDEYIRRGALRISLGDENTEACARGFLSVFTRLIMPKK